MLKRLVDVLVSLLLIVFFLPISAALALMVRCFLGSPILFYQARPGIHGEPFILMKFRTLENRASQSDEHASDEDRMTIFGKWLRSSSLDELPELWNVLCGDMSLVGPRPLLMKYLPLYNEDQARRHLVKPGITGWAQVKGRNLLSWEEKLSLDVWYVDNHNFLLDVKILLMTIKQVIYRRGIAAEGHATMPAFEGKKKPPFS
ncbi:sugar transferase [Halomonas organivorans]